MSVLAQPASPAEPIAPPDPPLPKTSVLLMVLLAVVTLGIYVPIWYVRRVKPFNALRSTVKLTGALPLAALALVIIQFGAAFMQGILEALGVARLAGLLSAYGSLLNLGYAVVMLVLAFRIRDVLQDHLRARVADYGGPSSVALQAQVYSLSGVWTFLFNAFYLQWKINEFHRELTSGDDEAA